MFPIDMDNNVIRYSVFALAAIGALNLFNMLKGEE